MQSGVAIMSNRQFAIQILEDKGSVVLTCNGSSMIPIIFPKETIHIKKVFASQLRVGDAVFVRICGNLQVHKIGAIDKNRYRIENNKGHINGWVGIHCIFGLATKIEDRVLVSDEELQKRFVGYYPTNRLDDKNDLTTK